MLRNKTLKPTILNALPFCGLFDLITIYFFSMLFISIEQLPTPVKIRNTEANEEAKLTEFQQELLQLAAVLKGDHVFTSYPEKIGKEMNVRQGKEYIDDAVKRFFEAGLYAKRMGVDQEQIVQMRPSLTTRLSKSSSKNP
jgi:phospholipase C